MRLKNAVVQEAICFLGFEATVEESVFAAYYDKVRNEYPQFTPVSQQTTTWGFGPEGPLPPQQSLQQLMRYARKDRSAVITLSPDTFALHILYPYPGWQEVLMHIRFAWGQLIETIQPTTVNRLALHYINAIPSNAETEKLGHWLKPNDFLPSAVLDSYPLAPCQIQWNSGQENMYRVSVAKAFPGNNPYGAFIWEIERVKTGQFGISAEQVVPALNSLHDEVRHVFDTAVGPNLTTLMNLEPQQ